MESLIESLGINNIILILSSIIIVLFLAFLILIGKVISLNKKYKKFMVKLRRWKGFTRRFRKLYVQS